LDVHLGPGVRAIIVFAEDVVPTCEAARVGPGIAQFGIDESGGLRA